MVQVGKSQVTFAKSLRTHATDDTVAPQDFTRLPGGIVNGVARLVSMEIGVYKKATEKRGIPVGAKFFRAAATVLSPSHHTERFKRLKMVNGKVVMVNGKPVLEDAGEKTMNCRGLQTSIMVPLCDTKRTVKGQVEVVSRDDHIAEMLNYMRLVAGPDCTASLAELPENATEDQAFAAIAGICDGIKAAKPLVKFGTRRADPTPEYPNSDFVNEDWYDSKDIPADFAAKNGQAGGGVQDETGDAGAEEPATETEGTDEGGEIGAENKEPAADEVAVEDMTLEQLGAAADAEAAANADEASRPAIDRLSALTTEAGLGDNEYATYADMAAAVAEAQGAAEGATEETETTETETVEEPEPEPAPAPAPPKKPAPAPAAFKPVKGEVYGYYPAKLLGKDGKPAINPRTKKKFAAVKCEVVAVYAPAKQVKLKNLDDKRTHYDKVPFAKLIK